jgi:hypothetical protein
MLRFLALICTIALTGLAVAAQWIAASDVPLLTPFFKAVLPGQIESRAVGVIVVTALQYACYRVCHFYLQRLYGYAVEETDAAARAIAAIAAKSKDTKTAQPVRWKLRRPRQGRFWSAMERLFATPAGGWLAPFAIPMTIIVFLASPLAFTGQVPATVWGLTALYARTLASVRRDPDVPEPLLEPERVPGSA